MQLHKAQPCRLTQDPPCNLQGPVQNDNVGILAQKLYEFQEPDSRALNQMGGPLLPSDGRRRVPEALALLRLLAQFFPTWAQKQDNPGPSHF